MAHSSEKSHMIFYNANAMIDMKMSILRFKI